MKAEFHLYRAKFIRPPQVSFLHDEGTATALFVQSLNAKPYAQFRKDYTWHIANLEGFNLFTGRFAVGRSSQTSIPKLNASSGDFEDTEADTSPYTFVVYDATLGILAIQKESGLTSTTEEVAKKIEKLLGQTEVIMRNEVDVRIDPIPDPQDFITRLETAYAIKKFTAWFTGPNPFDADELFQKPLSVYVSEAGGDCGETTIQGASLDKDVVISVAKSTAATANSASARIQEQQGKRPKRINLSGDPLKLIYEDDRPDLKHVLKDAQGAYKKVRL